MPTFIRLGETINKKEDKRVVSVTVKPTITDCTGTLWITDLMLQEGPSITGYAPCTKDGYLAEMSIWNDGYYDYDKDAWFNGIVRSKATVVLLTLGEVSAGLDIYLYPKDNMSAGSVELSQGAGGHKVSFPDTMSAGDDVALLATTRKCTKNGDTFTKKGFYQYSAAWDSKHNVTLEDRKTARVLYTIQQMQEGVKR